ncbi:hypothetical protein [Actinomadura rubrisoli]|uniref:Uncharacterized protein n=1 Tax=Actinomadura rubrisoli TaxID=2530368 RepID=A0A4R4ZWN0_9ACTN|nr:hypothetical protein [Actinomadura rubrisoli]TDD62766.1 hypothetical protein E1298_44415 [Actinomadura rubrisoli]
MSEPDEGEPHDHPELERAERGWRAAREAQLAATHTIITLLVVIYHLFEEDEADDDGLDAHRLRRELAETRLRRARSVRDEAEELMADGHGQVERLRRLMDRRDRVPAPPADEPPLITEPLTAEDCDRYLAEAADSLARISDAVNLAGNLLEPDPAEDHPVAATDGGWPVDDVPGTDPPKGMVYGCVTVLIGSLRWLMLVAVAGLVGLIVVDNGMHVETKAMTSDRAVTGTRPSQIRAPKEKGNQGRRTALAYRLAAGQTVTTSFALPRMKRMWLPSEARYFTGSLEFRGDSRCAARSRLVWTLGDDEGRLALGEEIAIKNLGVPDRLVLSARLAAPAPCGGTLYLSYPRVTNYARPVGGSL